MLTSERIKEMEPYVEVFRQLMNDNLIMGIKGETYERCCSHYKGYLIEKSLGNTINYDNIYNKDNKTMTYWRKVKGFFSFNFTYDEIVQYFEFEREYSEYLKEQEKERLNCFDDFYSEITCEEFYRY